MPPAAALENLRGQWVAYARVRMYGGLLLSLQIWGWLEAALSSARGFNPPGGGAASASHSVVPLHVTVAVVFFCGILGIVWGIVGSVGARGLAQGTPVGRELARRMATIALLDVPFGTVLSIFLLRGIARVNALPAPKP
ncbi:MAG TPA: hypothetical protein VJX29_07130 [Candidatus Acidoferrales bacterium]|nr:hypothetical protein [Candidatus Acidoferrales bacterium]